MSESKLVFLFGYSGHSYVIIESLLQVGYSIGGYFDFHESTRNPYQLKYMGCEKEVDVKKIVGKNLVFPSVGDNGVRQKLIIIFEDLELNQAIILDSSARISPTAQLGKSTYIGKNVVVNAQSKIGKGTILNTGCIIEHECVIDDFVHIGPGAVLCGNVHIGNNSFVGANAVIKQNISIMNQITVGAGSVVIKDINEQGIYVGNPVKIK
ncbi:acetyltransferase [Cyclobacterium jeungdonense]|uniref:Acetyltransferase n=1 Tax=Cyclobacterium jeungdonense TaxID=708087 RepID=A0ABT8C4J3_9BACT|nr:acetyltransferase [Cyclobacterium jeungdonense]MDN3686533.1 acetyltransferase [Cyclobacterium jeungdonense]